MFVFGSQKGKAKLIVIIGGISDAKEEGAQTGWNISVTEDGEEGEREREEGEGETEGEREEGEEGERGGVVRGERREGETEEAVFGLASNEEDDEEGEEDAEVGGDRGGVERLDWLLGERGERGVRGDGASVFCEGE